MLNSLLLLCGFYTLLDALAPRGVLAWQFSFATFYFLALGALVLALVYGARRNFSWLGDSLVLGYTAFFCLGFVGVLFQSPLSFRYVAGDAAVMSLPMIFLISFATQPPRISRSTWIVFLILLGCAAGVALISGSLNLFPDYARAGGRFDAPHCILVSAAAVWVARSGVRDPGAVLVLTILLVLAAVSGWRSYFLQVLLVCFLAFFVLWSRRSKYLAIAVATVAALVVVQQSGDNLLRLLDDSRFAAVARLEIDDSTQGRINEVLDVVRITRQDATPIQIVFGHGHGALFEPLITEAERNLVYGGFVHHIHFGPAMLFFRYGAIGLIIYFLIIAALTKDVLFRRIELATSPVLLVLFLSAGGTMFVSLFVNVFNEPLSVLIMTAYICARRYTVPRVATDAGGLRPDVRKQIQGHESLSFKVSAKPSGH